MTINIYSDVNITRRQRLHFILSEDGQKLATHQTLEQCLDWIQENGYTYANVWGQQWVWSVVIHQRCRRDEIPPWLEEHNPLADSAK